MRIEVAVNDEDPQKKKGDLLEKIAKDLLEFQNYQVETEVRRTGVELDLICLNKANPSKKIYVECKAYDKDNNIQAGVIKQLYSAPELYGYEEAWLISTTELGKDAKGLVEKISQGERSKSYTFYTPQRLIEAFISSHLIKHYKVIEHEVLDLVKDENNLGEIILFITEYGYFWAVEYLSGGKPDGIIFAYAKTGNVVKDRTLLNNLAATKSSFNGLNFLTVFGFCGQTESTSPNIDVKDCKLNKEYLEQINDLGMKILHPNKSDLVLDDVYIYPDFEYTENDIRKKSNSQRLLDLSNEFSKCLIFGDDLAGKTSLAVTLQKNLNEKGKIPLYLRAEEIRSSDSNRFFEFLVKVFKEQYNDDQTFVEFFIKLLNEERQNVVIIIDNYESLAIKREVAQLAFFKMLKENFEHILIFANISIEIEALVKSETQEMLKGFIMCRILHLGHVLRDELIEKWLTVEQKETLSDSHLLIQKSEISQKINIAIGVNFIPTYPLYVLTMLQIMEQDSKSRLQGSSYAELYRYLINHALGSANAKADDLDFYHTYLSYIAHHFFTHRVKELTEEEMTKVYSNYSKMMDVEKSFDKVHGLIIKAKILKNESGLYTFNHNYSYYFFVAKYLSDNLEIPEIKDEIINITELIFISEYANIIIFLIHHSKNREVIDRIILEANRLLSEVTPYTLSKEEIRIINDLINEEISLSIEDSNPSHNRRKVLERKDKFEEEKRKKINEDSEVDDDQQSLDVLGKVNLSFKLIEVLGQITNNLYWIQKAGHN